MRATLEKSVGCIIVVLLAVGLRAAIADDAAPLGVQPGDFDRAYDILNHSLGSVSECYRGATTRPADDLLGRAIDAVGAPAFDQLLKKAAAPNGLCDLVLKDEFPFELSVAVAPGVSVSATKVCKLLQHPPKCPR